MLDYRHIRWSFFFLLFPRFQFEQNSLSLPPFFVVSCQPVMPLSFCQGIHLRKDTLQ